MDGSQGSGQKWLRPDVPQMKRLKKRKLRAARAAAETRGQMISRAQDTPTVHLPSILT